MLNRLGALIRKELIQFVRDPILVGFVLLAPAIQITLLGRAIGQDIRDIPVAVIDYDLSPLSREIITALDNTEELIVSQYPANLDEARQLIDADEVMAVVVIPRGFMSGTRSLTDTPQIQVVLDGTTGFIAARALAAAQGAIQSLVAGAVVASGQTSYSGITVSVDAVFNRVLSLQPDAISSQLALITFEVIALVAAMGFVRERELGTIEMLSITPLRRLELIAGKALTPLIIGIIDFLLMFGVTQVVFHVPMRGSFALLFGLTVLYLMCETCYALLVSTVTRTQQQAVTVVFVWAMLGLTLSGYLVPITNLPKVMQWASWLIPLRHYIALVGGVMLKGAGPMALLPDMVPLGILTVGMLFVTTRTLSRAIE